MQYPIWLEIDLQAIANNCREVKRLIPAGTCFMAVVKANAYGHGDVQVAKTALQNGADSLAVSRLQEGIGLRNAGIRAPILVFGPVDSEDVCQLAKYDLMQTVFDARMAKDISRQAQSLGVKIKIHIKVDTGMGRLGLNCVPEKESSQSYNELALKEASEIASLPGLEVQGFFTHFAQADNPDKSYTYEQLHRFLDFVTVLKTQKIQIPLLHAANSAATIEAPETHLGMVRPGIMLYGVYPSGEVECPRKSRFREIHLEPAMTLKTRIIQIKDVPAGYRISYGSTYTTPYPTRIAVLAVGYADGYPRYMSSQGAVLIKGRRVPVVGRVCMDQTVIDIGGLPDIDCQDEVVVFGKQSGALLPVQEIAEACSTIHYEIVTSISDRVPRIYYPESTART